MKPQFYANASGRLNLKKNYVFYDVWAHPVTILANRSPLLCMLRASKEWNILTNKHRHREYSFFHSSITITIYIYKHSTRIMAWALNSTKYKKLTLVGTKFFNNYRPCMSKREYHEQRNLTINLEWRST